MPQAATRHRNRHRRIEFRPNDAKAGLTIRATRKWSFDHLVALAL
jgi:hypothetical protein